MERDAGQSLVAIADVDVIAPNFKRRLSGVTSTIIQLVPAQRALGQKIATLGPGLPANLPHIRFRDLARLWRRPTDGSTRVWHARRNIEMLAAVVLRDVLRMPLRVAFTSASQRRHTGWSRFLIGRMDAVIATSAKTAAYLQVPNTVILHGIDTRRFHPPGDRTSAKRAVGLDPSQKIVGCFGRVRHQKGTDLFVDTMIRLLGNRPDWTAIIAGRATEQHQGFERDLKERVVQAGLAGRILFVGEHVNIPDWYRALDLFIAPQRWEGFGLTPLEAMATGVPVVATDVGAFAEQLASDTGDVGLLIPADDADKMAIAAASFMDDPARLAETGQRALAHAVEKFDIEREATRLGKVYRELSAR